MRISEPYPKKCKDFLINLKFPHRFFYEGFNDLISLIGDDISKSYVILFYCIYLLKELLSVLGQLLIGPTM